MRSIAIALLGLWCAPLLAEDLDPTKLHAVIVGVLEWQHGLQPYPKQHRKDQELRDVLVKRGTPPENIALLLDQEGTLANVRAALTRVARSAGTDSTLLVYYAGHGMPSGSSDYCFANYEMQPGNAKATGWSLSELGETLANEFKGRRVLLCADCCYSGGLEIVVDRLARVGIAAANVTSASRANTSTNNWTFSQCLIDGLRGEPLVDASGDGRITLGELAVEVQNAMQHLEGQLCGYKAAGIGEDFVLAMTSGALQRAADAPFPIGSYVVAGANGEQRTGRVVGRDGERYTVQFYDYSDKRTASYPADQLSISTREAAKAPAALDAGVKPDCEVEWRGTWWSAKLVKESERQVLDSLLGLRELVGRVGRQGPVPGGGPGCEALSALRRVARYRGSWRRCARLARQLTHRNRRSQLCSRSLGS